MPDARALDALSRIERALVRIEAAAARPAPAAVSDPEDYRRLQETHDRLRERVGGALAQLDGLLEREGRG